MFRPIGIFDSGVGGVSVLRDAMALLPHERFLFYGDNANAPYGLKSPEEIRACVRRVVDELLQRDVKALVIACNTATAAAAKELRETLALPVIGMEPALKPAHALLHGGQILVLATPATLHMEKFQRLMALYGEGAVPVEGRALSSAWSRATWTTPRRRRPCGRSSRRTSPGRRTPSSWGARTTSFCAARSSASPRGFPSWTGTWAPCASSATCSRSAGSCAPRVRAGASCTRRATRSASCP